MNTMMNEEVGSDDLPQKLHFYKSKPLKMYPQIINVTESDIIVWGGGRGHSGLQVYICMNNGLEIYP